jgi:hypothetical protein
MYNTRIKRSDPNTNRQIAYVRVWVLSFAQQEGKREGGHAWWVLVAGEGLNEGLGTSRRAAAVAVAAAAAVAVAVAQMERTLGERETGFDADSQ